MRGWVLVSLLVLMSGCLNPTAKSVQAPSGDLPWTLECFAVVGWDDPCTGAATLDSGPANENFLAVNPTDPMNVVIGAKNYNLAGSDCVWAGVSATHDGGRTWKTTFVGGDKANRATQLATFQCVTDPMLAFGADGTLYYIVEAYGRIPRAAAGTPLPHPLPALGGSGLFLAISHDGGLTFPSDEIRTITSRADANVEGLDDRTCLIVGPTTDTLYMGWGTQGTDRAFFAMSRDKGMSWTEPLLLNEGEPGFPFPVCPTLALDGTLYIVWRDGSDGGIRFLRSEDDGASFTAPRTLFNMPTIDFLAGAEFYVISQPFLAVDRSSGPASGTLYLVFPDQGEDGFDIRLTRSLDRGKTWEEPWSVDPTGASDQFHPTIIVDDQGAIHITYYDRGYDSANRLVDVTWAWSGDARNFTYQRLTHSSFDGDLGNHQEGHPFLGDYNGLADAGGFVYASFADNRMGRSDVALARLVRA